MKYSYNTYPGDGTQSHFALSFQYLSKAHVRATVDGVDVSFKWLTSSTVEILPAPSGEIIVKRETPIDKPQVVFKDGSILKDKSLNVSSLQMLFVAQEQVDNGIITSEAAIRAVEAATKAKASELAAKSSEDAAKVSEDRARAYQASAAGSAQQAASKASEAQTTIETVRSLKDEATTQRNAARDHRDKAEDYADEAKSYSDTAKSYRDTANSHRTSAESSKNTATTKAQEAATSASQAKTYRDQAAASIVEGVGQDTIDWGHLKPSLRNVLPDKSKDVTFDGKLAASYIDLLNTTASMKDQDWWLGRYRFVSQNTDNISTNKSTHCLLLENKQYAPANASDDLGRRFYKRGLLSISYVDGNSPGKTYEAYGAMFGARQRGSSAVRTMAGLFIQAGSENETTGEVNNLYGFRSHAFVNGKGKVGYCYGAHITINPNTVDAHITYPRGLYIHMDYDAGTIDNEPIALYQNFDGSWGGHRRIGIWQNDVQYNFFTGTTYIDNHEVLHAGNASEIGFGFGAGQSWQDMTASRSINTTYQNTTGKVIQINIMGSGANTSTLRVSENNTDWKDLSLASAWASAFGLIPNGHYYRLTSGTLVSKWTELR